MGAYTFEAQNAKHWEVKDGGGTYKKKKKLWMCDERSVYVTWNAAVNNRGSKMGIVVNKCALTYVKGGSHKETVIRSVSNEGDAGIE